MCYWKKLGWDLTNKQDHILEISCQEPFIGWSNFNFKYHYCYAWQNCWPWYTVVHLSLLTNYIKPRCPSFDSTGHSCCDVWNNIIMYTGWILNCSLVAYPSLPAVLQNSMTPVSGGRPSSAALVIKSASSKEWPVTGTFRHLDRQQILWNTCNAATIHHLTGLLGKNINFPSEGYLVNSANYLVAIWLLINPNLQLYKAMTPSTDARSNH